MKISHKFIVSTPILFLATAHAGGLYLYETSTTDIGLASAGMAARAQDSSVIAANPAGLANVEGQSFSGNFINLYGDATLDTIGGGNAGNTIQYVPLGSAFYSQKLNDKWTIGAGLYGNYGLGLQYEHLFSRLEIPSATTQALTFQPSASYRINEQLSVGASLGIHYGIFDLEAHSTNSNAINIDQHDTDVQVNGKLGLLYEVNQDTRIGLAYTNETEFEFDTTNALAPQQFIVSAFHNINDKLAIMGNLNWQDWSDYQTIMGAETQDTYQIALGTQYKINPRITWNAGFAYDSSMYSDQSHGDITLPAGKAYRVGSGIDYKLDNSNTISIALEATLIDSSEFQGPQGKSVAQFNDPALYFLSLGYSWGNH
ncbi:long-chain fatty acid transporter [Vibrio zhanjiangensis]|uniref:Long-chain fatty acid transporter n=1 Tax=Vibrio zhanjiangensis TaxID=1046128 RepID=A0ABQ6F3L4_9VIBR|nr:outer membrane protein transport protein [Vibrio zhanjiangensis]GLT19806.1 long-chain fatty acid transporter [Vibrio zhanjiangensis]